MKASTGVRTGTAAMDQKLRELFSSLGNRTVILGSASRTRRGQMLPQHTHMPASHF